MIVTKFKYHIESALIPKIDLMCERCTGKSNKDNVLLVEGGEGEGKTTMSIGIAIYAAEKTNRPFGVENIFFDLEKMIEFAQSTKEQIIIWDEPALQALSTDWASKNVKNLTRLLMMARKKRHFIIINMTKFFKFNEYIVVDRAVGMIHVYSRKNLHPGRFIYIKRSNLEPLWRDYRFGKKRNYMKYAAPHIKGQFANILSPKHKNNILSGFDVDKYESNKDEAIKMIGGKADPSRPEQIKKEINIKLLEELQNNNVSFTQAKLGEIFGVSARTIQEYARELREREPQATPLL